MNSIVIVSGFCTLHGIHLASFANSKIEQGHLMMSFPFRETILITSNLQGNAPNSLAISP
jgi:hypothetical protein